MALDENNFENIESLKQFENLEELSIKNNPIVNNSDYKKQIFEIC